MYILQGIGVQVDSPALQDIIKPYYDSMIAELIVYGVDRKDALRRCNRALGNLLLKALDDDPVTQSIINNKDFIAGKYNTGFIEKFIKKRIILPLFCSTPKIRRKAHEKLKSRSQRNRSDSGHPSNDLGAIRSVTA